MNAFRHDYQPTHFHGSTGSRSRVTGETDALRYRPGHLPGSDAGLKAFQEGNSRLVTKTSSNVTRVSLLVCNTVSKA